MSSSEFSATSSISFSRYSCACAWSSSGISWGSGAPLPSPCATKAFMSIRSITPRTSCSEPIGISVATTCVAEGALERLQGPEEVGPLAVEHVDEDEAGKAFAVSALPEPLGVDLDAHHRVHDNHRGIDHPKRRDRVGDEARLPGRVDQVDLASVVLKRGDRGADRHLALVLVPLEVGDGGAVLDTAEAVDDTGLEEQRFVERRLAAAAMADQGDVPDSVCGLVRHWARTLYASPAVAKAPLRRPQARVTCASSAWSAAAERPWSGAARQRDSVTPHSGESQARG